MPNYKVISRVQRDGDWIGIPDDAVDVTVQPLPQQYVRVTYLKPVTELTVDGESAPRRRRYVE